MESSTIIEKKSAKSLIPSLLKVKKNEKTLTSNL
jgi:hypothetical protein